MTIKEFFALMSQHDLDVQVDGDLITTVTRRIFKETGRPGNYKTFAFVPRSCPIPTTADYYGGLASMSDQSLESRAKEIIHFWKHRHESGNYQ